MASEVAVVEQSETTRVSSLDVQLYAEERLRLGAQQGSSDHSPMVEQILIDLV